VIYRDEFSPEPRKIEVGEIRFQYSTTKNFNVNRFTRLRGSNHGSRTPEKEEEIFDLEDQDEAEVEEGQSFGQSHHRSELVLPHHSTPITVIPLLSFDS
jgi:hypothetical protein